MHIKMYRLQLEFTVFTYEMLIINCYKLMVVFVV